MSARSACGGCRARSCRGRAGKLIINVASPKVEARGGGFQYASSRDAFERLSTALDDYTRGSSIAVRTILPEEAEDDDFLAAEVISLVAASFLDIESAPMRRRRTANDRK